MKKLNDLLILLTVLTFAYCSFPNTCMAAANNGDPSFPTVITTEGKYPVNEVESSVTGQNRADFVALSTAQDIFSKSLKTFQPLADKHLTDQQLVVAVEALTTSAKVAHSTKKMSGVNCYYVKTLNTLDLNNLSASMNLVLNPQVSSLSQAITNDLKSNASEITQLLTLYYAAKTKPELENLKNQIVTNEANFEAFNCTLQSFIAYVSGDYDSGKTAASKAIDYNKNYANAYLIRGMNLMAAKDSSGAIIDFTAAIANDPKLYSAYYDRGVLYCEMNDTVKAIADFTNCVSLQSDSIDPYVQRGSVYYQLHKNDLALADFSKVLTLDTKNAQVYLKRGNIYYEQNNFDAALADYQQATDLGINDATVLLIIGNINYDQKKYTDAIATYYKYLTIARRDVNVYLKLGNCFDQLQQYDTAVIEYSNALNYDRTVPMYFYRANDYFILAATNKTQYDLAIADCSAIIAIDAGNADAYILSGRCYKALLNQDLAIADFSKAIELNPANTKLAVAFNFRAWCYAAKGGNSNNVHAAQDFLKAQIIDPTNPDYDYSLAQFYDSIKFNTAEIISAYKSFIKKAAANPAYTDKVAAAKKRVVELGGQL